MNPINPLIFRAYDVRAVYPDEINKEDAFKIGLGTAKFLQARSIGSGQAGKRLKIVVGEDARVSSPDLRGAVIDGLTKGGADVIYIGQATTPLFYYSVIELRADGGLMATASHNPPQYGGLKIVGAEASPIGGDSGLKEIEKLANANLEPVEKAGSVEEANLLNQYVDFVIKKSAVNPSLLRKLNIVVDAGNGMTSLVLKPLFEKLKLSYTPLFFEIDCSFPNHSPDISKKESVGTLIAKVAEAKADIGIAFDGDGDRITLIDEKGNKLNPGFILALLFKSGSGFFHKPKTVYDLRLSKSIRELFGKSGLRSKVGHANIKQVMRKNDADMGGEMSGHFFFKEMKYAESSVLTMLKVLKIISERDKPLSDLVGTFEKYFHSGEINVEVQNREDIITALKNKYGQADELDGITIDLWNSNPPDGGWWFNARPSNTEPILRIVVEAKTKDLLEKKVFELKTIIG